MYKTFHPKQLKISQLNWIEFFKMLYLTEFSKMHTFSCLIEGKIIDETALFIKIATLDLKT